MKKNNLKKKVTASLNLPPEYVLNVSKITISDFSSLTLLNYKSIIEYNDSLIRINTKEKIIKIEGSSLNVDNITDEEITISGIISGLLFE